MEVCGGRKLSRAAAILTSSGNSPSVFSNLILFRRLIVDDC